MKSMAIPTDEELINRFKESDDTRAFSILVERHRKHIYHKCYSYTHDKDTAEDLCQEILIKLYLQIRNFRNEARFPTWLFSIIHSTCIDYLRKSKKNVRAVLTRKLTNELIDLVEEENEIPQEISVKILDELLDQLTPEDKMLLLMKYKEKYHIKDIQKTLGVSEAAIKMRLKRAREKINTLYLRYGT